MCYLMGFSASSSGGDCVVTNVNISCLFSVSVLCDISFFYIVQYEIGLFCFPQI